MSNPMVHPIPHPMPRGFRNKEEGREEKGERRDVDPLPTSPSLPKTRKPYETPTPDRLSDLERATVADAELIHDCRWKAEAARQRIANRKAEIERLREAA